MRKVKDTKFFETINDYFKVYLPKQRKRSPNTVKAYQSALEVFLDFVKNSRKITLTDMTFEMLSKQAVSDFLLWLDENRRCSISTQNQRLQCIRSFLEYAADCDSSLIPLYTEVRKIHAHTLPKSDIVTYMSEIAVKMVLSEPDKNTKKGLRDAFLMSLLYDTGARIQEILDVHISDINLRGTPVITLHGKGQKARNVSIMAKTVELMKKYISAYHPDESPYSQAFLFYTKHNGKARMSEDNARKLIRAYGISARENCSEIPGIVHPHLFRHSRAMHLYQHGMPLPLISQWLGHSNIETTQIYANADTEMKRKAIEAATPADSPLKDYFDSERYTVPDDELIKKLYGLR